MPDANARRSLVELSLKKLKLEDDLDLEDFADALEGYSGADITNLCRDAAMMSMRKAIKDKPLEELKQMTKDEIDKPITMEDLETAKSRCKHTCSPAQCEKYEKWIEKHGSF